MSKTTWSHSDWPDLPVTPEERASIRRGRWLVVAVVVVDALLVWLEFTK